MLSSTDITELKQESEYSDIIEYYISIIKYGNYLCCFRHYYIKKIKNFIDKYLSLSVTLLTKLKMIFNNPINITEKVKSRHHIFVIEKRRDYYMHILDDLEDL
jgi:hypothetical protein